MNDCLFCKIINGDIPSDKVYENDTVFAFKDIAPQAAIHILIIPKMHICAVTEINNANVSVISDLIAAANEIAKMYDLKTGFRLVFNSGEDAGQTVFHLHMHLLAGEPLGRFGTTE